MKEFTDVAREVARKRNERFIPIKIVLSCKNGLGMDSEEAEQLAVMTGPTKGLGCGRGGGLSMRS